jgi:hypothetical protein
MPCDCLNGRLLLKIATPVSAAWSNGSLGWQCNHYCLLLLLFRMSFPVQVCMYDGLNPGRCRIRKSYGVPPGTLSYGPNAGSISLMFILPKIFPVTELMILHCYDEVFSRRSRVYVTTQCSSVVRHRLADLWTVRICIMTPPYMLTDGIGR